MSNLKLYQRLKDLSFALTTCEDEEEREKIDDEIAEIEHELEEAEKFHFGLDRHEEH